MGGPVEKAARILDRAHRVTAHALDEGAIGVQTYQDVEPHLEYAAKCTMAIPFNVLMEISQKHNLQFFEPEDAKKILAIAKRDYPKFKTTIDRNL
jgi:hypothetical protein